MRDMALSIAPIVPSDNGSSCTICGRAFGPREPVFVAVPSWPESRLGHAVCGTCKPTRNSWGDKLHWRSFACENCGRIVRYGYGRQYRCCTYRCAAAGWTKRATERRSQYRAAHRVKQLSCGVCGTTFVATRRDARYCSTTCRQRAHRMSGQQ